MSTNRFGEVATKNRLTETIAELMNWPIEVAEIAIEQGDPQVNDLVAIWKKNHAAGAFACELNEIPDWYYRNVNDKLKNQGHDLETNAD